MIVWKLGQPNWHFQNGNRPVYEFLTFSFYGTIVCLDCSSRSAHTLLFDPLNIRYATDTTNMQLWIAHNAARACFVPPTGKVILFDFHNCEHLSAHLPLVGEVRGGASFFYFETGNRTDEHAAAFAGQITDLMREYGVTIAD